MENLYQRWKDAVPALNFPFQYRVKNEVITNSWRDVREGCYRDGISNAIHTATAHIAPTNMQSERIRDSIRRENRILSPRSPSSALSGTENSLPHIYVPRASKVDPMIAKSGRKEYLKSKRREKCTQESRGLWMTTSRMYGLGANIDSPALKVDSKYHRKVGGLSDAYRPKGVFPRTTIHS